MSANTEDLTGPDLDAAVWRALGLEPKNTMWTEKRGEFPVVMDYVAATVLPGVWEHYADAAPFEPSTRWDHGGPIIEEYAIDLAGKYPGREPWKAVLYGFSAHGSTALEAAMRVFVMAKEKT